MSRIKSYTLGGATTRSSDPFAEAVPSAIRRGGAHRFARKRCVVQTRSATSRPSRRTRNSCHGAPTNGRFPATNLNRSLAGPGHQESFPAGGFPAGQHDRLAPEDAGHPEGLTHVGLQTTAAPRAPRVLRADKHYTRLSCHASPRRLLLQIGTQHASARRVRRRDQRSRRAVMRSMDCGRQALETGRSRGRPTTTRPRRAKGRSRRCARRESPPRVPWPPAPAAPDAPSSRRPRR